MPEYIVDGGGNLIAKTWVPLDKLEQSALEQVELLKDFPALYRYAALMPDAHYGYGATIGSVIPTDGVIIPSAVGVDIGCGMVYSQSDIYLKDIQPHLKDIVHEIKRSIPTGFNRRDGHQLKVANSYVDVHNLYIYKAVKQLGTLGGGNHFIELQIDTSTNQVGVMIHSGSRNYGFQIAKRYMEFAKQAMKSWYVKVPKDLDFLPVDSMVGEDYIYEMNKALTFAFHNRQLMMQEVCRIVCDIVGVAKWDDMINIHHNYAALENHYGKNVWVHRKGATRVRKDIIGIIPGSMGTKSYLVSGTNNDESYHSCSHGAGRNMGRKEAKRRLSMEEFKNQMINVVSEDVNETHLDEAPNAYKDISFVMSCQQDLVKIEKELQPIANVKG